jgi:hypothetical protein
MKIMTKATAKRKRMMRERERKRMMRERQYPNQDLLTRHHQHNIITMGEQNEKAVWVRNTKPPH